MDNFQAGVLRNQKAVAKKLNAKATDTFGPNLGEMYSQFMALPALRGLWYAGNVDNTGAIADVTGQGRTLAYNGNPAIQAVAGTPGAMIPYYFLDGTGDFFSSAAAAGNNILGNETYVIAAARGLTVGGWFWANNLAANSMCIARDGNAGARQWLLWAGTDSEAHFQVSGDGTNLLSVVSTGTRFNINAWHFIVGRYNPSTEIAVFIDGVKFTTTAAIPATIFNAVNALNIGVRVGGAANILTGRFALGFMAAQQYPDELLTYMFNRSRLFFNV